MTLAYNSYTKASYALPLISFLCHLLYGLLHLYNFFFVSHVLCYLLFFFFLSRSVRVMHSSNNTNGVHNGCNEKYHERGNAAVAHISYWVIKRRCFVFHVCLEEHVVGFTRFYTVRRMSNGVFFFFMYVCILVPSSTYACARIGATDKKWLR